MRKFLLIAALTFGAFAVFAAEPTASHLAAAVEYLEAKGTPRLLELECQTMVDTNIRLQPELADYRAKMLEFYRGIFGFAVLKEDLAAIYAREYTEEELRELTRFYLSPIGKKSVAVEGKLVPEFAKLMERKTREAADKMLK